MFIIAEIFPQHSGSLELAETMILQSKMGGASAVKLQLYRGNQFSSDGLDRNYIELDRKGLARLSDYGRRIGIPVFSTAFDEERLNWVIDEDQAFYKIPSRMHKEDPALVEKILALGKPTFVSIPDGVDYDMYKGIPNLILLKCVSQYPTFLEDWDIGVFEEGGIVGISDHSPGISAALKSCALGATYLEKHFTISTSLQRSTEKAHLGAFTFEELLDLKRKSLEIGLIGNKPSEIV